MSKLFSCTKVEKVNFNLNRYRIFKKLQIKYFLTIARVPVKSSGHNNGQLPTITDTCKTPGYRPLHTACFYCNLFSPRPQNLKINKQKLFSLKLPSEKLHSKKIRKILKIGKYETNRLILSNSAFSVFLLFFVLHGPLSESLIGRSLIVVVRMI